MTNVATAITISLIGLPLAVLLALVFYWSVLTNVYRYIKLKDDKRIG
jgi:hypothetical protein